MKQHQFRPGFAQQFETIIRELFEKMGYYVSSRTENIDTGIDFYVEKEEYFYVELKFYRSPKISRSTLLEVANRFAFSISRIQNKGNALLILNTIVAEKVKEELLTSFGIQVWDRSILYSLFSEYSIDLRDSFEKLLISAQQGIDTYDVFYGLDVANAISEVAKLQHEHVAPKYQEKPVNKGEQLAKELNEIDCGKEGWQKYESKCLEILKFLFDKDLTLWTEQVPTDDSLSRFDLICRIASNDEFWKALISSFFSRFVLFEFKNYCEPIEQGQIYTTEKYLYRNALRSVAFIIARTGASLNAVQAAKGALREHGKLIIILSNSDLSEMLRLKDEKGSCNDYMSDILDNWLIGISR